MKEASARLSGTLVLVSVLLLLPYLIPVGLSQNYDQSYQLLDHPDGSTHYRLNVDVSESLYAYYTDKTHSLYTDSDFAKFVTSFALKPIADSLWQIYTDDEDFANGALMIVHQISYAETTPPEYPVETIVNNKGDCDLFSYIAASIMRAGGIDVVLLLYRNEAHMNIGVALSHTPQDARGQIYYVLNNNVRYYVAECTGGQWETGWRVGENPPELVQALDNVEVITLQNMEQWAPGQVSASYETLASSAISLTASATFLIQGSVITLTGQLSPSLQNRTVTIYVKIDTSPWTVLGTTQTDSNGRFTYAWSADSAGTCYVRANWSGDDIYSNADSPIQTVTVLSTFLVALLAVFLVLVAVGVVDFVMSRHAQPSIEEPLPPEIPS